MIRSVTALLLVLLLFSTECAYADFYDDCRNDCGSARIQCIEGITLFDAAGVQEAKNDCVNNEAACAKKCHDLDALGDDGYQEKLKNEAEDAERKRQEQEQEQNGGIKSYHFSD